MVEGREQNPVASDDEAHRAVTWTIEPTRNTDPSDRPDRHIRPSTWEEDERLAPQSDKTHWRFATPQRKRIRRQPLSIRMLVSCSPSMDRTEAEKNIAQLREEIRKHDRLYYQDSAPVISDREYDRLYKQLVDLETQFPDLLTSDSPTQRVGGKPLQAFAQIHHRAAMLSLDNTYSEEEVVNFYKRITRLLPDEKIPVVIEPKVDGVAVSVMYEKGRLKYAATRGDGLVGDDITQNVKTIRSVPHQLRGDAPTFSKSAAKLISTRPASRN